VDDCPDCELTTQLERAQVGEQHEVEQQKDEAGIVTQEAEDRANAYIEEGDLGGLSMGLTGCRWVSSGRRVRLASDDFHSDREDSDDDAGSHYDSDYREDFDPNKLHVIFPSTKTADGCG